ncbi:MAG: putative bifunctional diguanylate cyclase/phosphodiesterase [Gammaproteobacteria bacterium]
MRSDPAGTTPAPDDSGIEAETVRLLYANARAGEIVTAVVAATLAAAYRGEAPAPVILSWAAAMLGIVAGRRALRLGFERRDAQRADPGRWARAFAAGAAVTGLGWGALGAWAVWSLPLERAAVAIIVGVAMTAAALPYLAPWRPAYIGYACGATLPVVVAFALSTAPGHLALALWGLIYLAGALHGAGRLSGRLRESLALSLREAAHARALGHARDELEAETARRLALERAGREAEARSRAALERLVEERTVSLRGALDEMTATRGNLDLALDAGRLALFQADTRTRQVRLSPQWRFMIGGPREPTVTDLRTLMALTHPEDHDAVARAYRDVLRGRRSHYAVDHRVRTLNGDWLWIESRGRVTARDDRGRALCITGTNCDISDRKRHEAQILFQAYTDPLTGLANRARIAARLQETIRRAERAGRSFAVICIDLDHFKYINDTGGHAEGDSVIREVGTRLAQCVRASDLVGRLGGDEFAVLLEPPLEPEEALAVAEKMIARLREPLRAGEREVVVSASLGISLYPLDGREPGELMSRADIAMYHAKESGRNAVQFFTAELNARMKEKASLMAGLQTALDNGELWVAYQPRVDAAAGSIRGVEALLRWRHPVDGDVPAERFIPLAELTGAIVPIGEWVLDTACRQMRAWLDAGASLEHVAVNVSPRQLHRGDIVERVAHALRDSGLPAQRLELEITESVAMQDPERVVGLLAGLKRLGVRIALDDFGVGFSSLSYLKRFPIDELKIDRAFVAGLPADPSDVAIARTILALARSLGVTPVAEGVESADQRDFLLGEGCLAMQGFLFGGPMPASGLAAGRAFSPGAPPPGIPGGDGSRQRH